MTIKPTIWALDQDGIRQGILEPITAKAVLRDMQVGTWLTEIDADHYLAKRINPSWTVLIDDGITRISGSINHISTTIDATSQTLELSGVTDLHHLNDRLTYPNPLKPITQQDTAYYTAKGTAETVLKNLINNSCGTGALPERRSNKLVLEEDHTRGNPISVSERFTNLLDVVRANARAGGITFTAVRTDDGNITVSARVPQDLSRQVRFMAETGSAATGSLSIDSATVTTAIIAGQGEGTDRAITEVSRPSARRIEQLKDRRDTEDQAVVDQAAKELLDNGAQSASASFKISESIYTFDRDFTLGDTITVEFGAVQVSEAIRSAEITWDEYGREIELSLGDHNNDQDKEPAWVKKIQNIDARMRGLESK